MSSPHTDIHPQTEDEKTQDVSDDLKKDLFKKAMEGRWQDVARSYSENEKVRETRITWAGDTLLHLAVSSGKESNVKLLMGCLEKSVLDKRRQEILAIRNDWGDTALHFAAALGMVNVCLAMARLHPEMVVEIHNGWQETPLFKAVRHGQKKAFFALQSVLDEKLYINAAPGVRNQGVRRVRGDTILHEAIFAERFDLAFEIIDRYPDLVYYMNEKGESPLHVLAKKPSAFKSGTRFSLLESVIYDGISVDPLKLEYPSYQEKFRKNEGIDFEKDLHDGNHKLPDNYQACYSIFTLLKHAFKNIAPWTDDDDDRPKHTIDAETSDAVHSIRTTDKRDPENGVKERQNGSQNHPRSPKCYSTCFNFFKDVVKFVLITTGTGLWKVQKIKKKQQTNTHAIQIMEELLRPHRLWNYAKDGTTRGTAQGDQKPPTTSPPDVNDGSKQPNSQQIQDEILKKLEKCCCKQVEDDSKQKPVRVTPFLVAAKSGLTEMVEKILNDMPVAVLDMDEDDKNIVLIAAENRQSRVYELMSKREFIKDIVFRAVDNDGNSALHLAAKLVSNRPWPIRGAALQMQWEIKWYKYVLKSMRSKFFMHHNMKGETAQDILTNTHETLVQDAEKWLNNTSQSCSVVAVFIATVAFASATTVPGGVDQNSGFPIFEGKCAFQVFALSSLIALFFSVTCLTMFLSILTSHNEERDFERKLPVKLILGLTTLFLSVVANLVSFCAGHFLVIEQKLKYAAYPIYAAVLGLPVSFFALAQFPLYIDLLKANFAVVPQHAQTLHPS
ncbi:uncharacterized protein LOC103708122 isoform X2 [Phoenix dactylifera]|uniref:Uncharacterized protein LOC103708122 isoform X2 n=1 Tax=Phoenix dactylifera TaxID=42345 RepID=A0A8B8ZFH7_PHODC|nr:uncharacterized protein LOC103708122 isoform X2 [Phoenix dactylifera]